MTFRIADTFTSALAKLSNNEQKAVKTTVFDLQIDPEANGLRLHKLTGGRDKNFWSVSANMDVRIIIHRQGDNTLVCYVDHHDDAYAWANGRKLEVHPKTGAAQLVEIEQIEREVVIPIYTARQQPSPAPAVAPKKQHAKPPLAEYDASWLMQYGIPAEWVDKLKAATEDELLVHVGHLPGEAAEAVLDIATGTIPPVPVQKDAAPADPFEHPDALRRFRTIENQDELEAALELPWDKWRAFLHPQQRELAYRDYSGPARVSGAAGTGKTVVALHRAAYLVRQDEDALVLLTTISEALARVLKQSFNNLVRHEPQLAERVSVYGLDEMAQRLFKARQRDLEIATPEYVRELVLETAEVTEHQFTPNFLLREFTDVVDPWQVDDWEAYETIPRIGRRRRMAKSAREDAWKVFGAVRRRLAGENLVTLAGAYAWLTKHFRESDRSLPFTHIIVDEAQDVGVAQLRFLASLLADRPDGLFFAGDIGQRIFQTPFSWSALGVDVRGRAKRLRINYRTSHQIRSQADRLLAPELQDVDGNVEKRMDTQSVFNGVPPILRGFDSREEEQTATTDWLRDRMTGGIQPHEIAVFVRSAAQFERAYVAIEAAGASANQLDEKLRVLTDKVTLSSMHLAKGLEFKAVAIMACEEDVIPDPDRLENVRDMAEVEEVYDTERHLLYVAFTRARDFLWISYAGERSEFLDDVAVR